MLMLCSHTQDRFCIVGTDALVDPTTLPITEAQERLNFNVVAKNESIIYRPLKGQATTIDMYLIKSKRRGGYKITMKCFTR